MIAVTPAQRRILAAVNAWQWARRYGPSLREVANVAGYSSTSGLHRQLEQLSSLGLVSFAPLRPRSLRLGPGVAGSRNGQLAQVVTVFRRCHACAMDVPDSHVCPTSKEAA